MKYISEILEKSYQSWECRDIVTIEAPTGSGKTTFVLQELLPYAISMGQEILYLCNRKLLQDQLSEKTIELEGLEEYEIDEGLHFAGITLMTYQKLQEIVKNGIPSKYLRYRYIIFDEIHYYLADANFNPKIPLLGEYISKSRNSCRIFISATLKEVKPYLWTKCKVDILDKQHFTADYLIQYQLRNEFDQIIGKHAYLWEYTLPEEKRDYKIYAYDDYKQIKELICLDKSNDKWLFFVNSKKTIDKLKEEMPEEMMEFVDSECKGNQTYDSIVYKERYEKKLLVATKVIDNGVNIKDQQLKHIIMDSLDEVDFKQMLGRKRMRAEEEVNIYLPKKSVNYFNGCRYEILQHLSAIKKIHTMPDGQLTNESILNLLEDKSLYSLVYDFCYISKDKIFLNYGAVQKMRIKFEFYERQMEGLKTDELYFIKTQLKWLGQCASIEVVHDLKKNKLENGCKCIINFLQEYANRDLGPDLQKELRVGIQNIAQEYGLPMGGKKVRIPGKKVLEDFFFQERNTL